MQLRALHADAELLHQIERIEAAQAGDVEVLAEDQHQQDRNHPGHGTWRQQRFAVRRGDLGLGGADHQMLLIPTAHIHQQADAQQRCATEPRNAALPVRRDDGRRQQRTERRAGIATQLEHRLRHAVATARCEARDTRGFRMEDGRADTHQHRRHQHHAEVRRVGQQQQSAQGRGHAYR
ncbi:hypothetical protein D3C71_1160450 [compost metagenome]